MVGPLTMVDENGDVKTPVTSEIASVSTAPAWNQSAVWSATSGTIDPENAFDGSLSTKCVVSSNAIITASTFTASSISFYKNGNDSEFITTITVNGTDEYPFPKQATATGWVTVDLGSEVTVTSMTSSWNGAYSLYAVKADDLILVDTGIPGDPGAGALLTFDTPNPDPQTQSNFVFEGVFDYFYK
jgi:hypothetical protein